MSRINTARIAWLVPSAEYGAYWPPILHELAQQFDQVKFYTGRLWPRFDADAPGTSVIQVVGKTKFFTHTPTESGYGRGFIIASPAIIGHLFQFKPDVIFASGFSLWTLFALLLKPLGGWRVVLVYDGSSPNVDFQDSSLRSFFRRWMVKFADALVSNSQGGKHYLIDILGAEKSKVDAVPYLVPDSQTLIEQARRSVPISIELCHPVFLFVGQVIHRKGLHLLLAACAELQQRGYTNYSLLVAGDGPHKEELEKFSQEKGLSDRVHWLGWVAYEDLGSYFQAADVFVFPTLEDIWGMVTLEAMVCSKAIICSKWAGTAEMIVEGETGYLVDPHNVEELTQAMIHFIEKPELIQMMGEKSHKFITQYTPATAASFLSDVTTAVLNHSMA